jgi:hypothetical protein
MGFDPEKVPIVSHAFQCTKLPFCDHSWRDIVLRSNEPAWDRRLVEISSADTFHFEPHFGWKGHIELDSAAETEKNAAVEARA